MLNQDNFPAVFTRLKQILQPLTPPLVVQADTADTYTLAADRPSKKHPQGFFVASIQIKKNYVSFHLMPIYMRPDLLEPYSPQLKKRMQGKACFNFTSVDEPLMTELAQLTTASIESFRQMPLP